MPIPLPNRLLVITLIWVVTSFLIHELCSLDIWWQLVIGEDILQRLQIPVLNIYSAGALNQPYHDSHWLFQVLLAFSHRLAGLNGPILLMALLWGLTLLVLYRDTRSSGPVSLTVLLVFLAAGASAERFLPRPEIVTFLMIALFYAQLRQEKYITPGQVILLCILQIIWVNSHGLFVIGPFMVGCYWLHHLINKLRDQPNNFKQLSLLLVLITTTLFISPYGSGALEYSYLLFHEVGKDAPAHMQAVNELSPTFGESAMKASAFWFFLSLLGLASLALAAQNRQVNLARLLIVVALCLAALTGRRNIVLFALVASPFVMENLGPSLSQLKIKPWIEKGGQALLILTMLLWSTYPLSGRYYIDMELPARAGLGVTPDFFPHGLPAFIEQNDIQGQVYNTNRLGGFYLYHLFPQRIPLIDGRWEVYGEPYFRRQTEALSSYESWKLWADELGITNALLHHTSPQSQLLAPALYRDPTWSLVYYDFSASFFVKNEAMGKAKPIYFSPSSQALPGDVRPDSRFMLSVFYRNLGLKQPLLDNLEQSLSFGYHEEQVLLELARVNMELGRLSEAEQHYMQVLTHNASHLDALSDLAFINYQKRDFQQALVYSQRAVKADPENNDILFNHAMALTGANQTQQAITLLNQILKKEPDYRKAKQLLNNLQR